MTRRGVEFTKNVVAVLVALVFQFPNRRFDQLSGVEQGEFESLRGHDASVLEEVTGLAGRVLYSGASQQG